MTMKHHLAFLAATLAGSMTLCAQQTICVQDLSRGKTFDGIGAVNGGGATSVLLKDYPEPQRSQIMDLVFKPQFGASVSTTLVEVPGDGNSTQGSMPSHSHWRGDHNYQRGYIWWVLKEAQKRNPRLTLDATAWSAPRWVGDFWSQDMADYYVDWLEGARRWHGLEFDALGCHNEKGYSYDFAKRLRRTMDERGFGQVRLHAFDNWGRSKLDFLDEMLRDSTLAASIDVISAHTFGEIAITPEQRAKIEQLGKPVWNSEDHIYLKGYDCLIGIVKCFNENYIVSGASKIVNWYDIAGVYPMEPYSHDPAMIIAWEPWSGHYEVRENVWAYAHYGQFSQAGWQYLDEGCCLLEGGGSMVMLRNPDTSDYSIIVETKEAQQPQTVQIRLPKGLSTKALCQWTSDAQEQFVRRQDIRGGRRLTLTLQPGTVYSFSTTNEQQKGHFDDIPASQPFPFPYTDDFETNAIAQGYLPRYLADIIGCYELVPRPDGEGQCLRQVVGDHTLSWAPEWHHYTILGDRDWTDYAVSADVWLNPGDEAAIMGRVCDVGAGYGVWAKGYYLRVNDRGQCDLVITRGKLNPKELIGDAEQQALILARKDIEVGGEYVLDSAEVPDLHALTWHRLCLRFRGDEITGFVDGQQVVQTHDNRYPRGMAGLLAPLRERSVSTPYFDNLNIQP